MSDKSAAAATTAATADSPRSLERVRLIDKLLAKLGLRDLSPNDDRSLTPEQRALGKKLARNKRIAGKIWEKMWLLRTILTVVGVVWILLLPHPLLWKRVFHDEHALQPAQVSMYFNWDNVHKADTYLANLERLRDDNADWETIKAHLVSEFSLAGHESGNTTSAAFARVAPPRSEGTEAILISANWLSRDPGAVNVRGVAMLLSLAEFFRRQTHWAFDIFLVVGDDYLAGLEDFMTSHNPRANIWTALNLDYPYHSFSHLGVYYEGVNGRLPNQDVINTAAHVARWSGGVDPALHSLPARPNADYLTGLKHLVGHVKFAALGRPSAAHGVLAKHRIDAVTLYGVPAEGPHGFYTLGRTIESTLRSFNNLLERLHASFFFYLLPHPDYFLPVGHYLPAAVILGASVTFAGFDCPDPLAGVLWAIPAVLAGLVGWLIQNPAIPVALVGGSWVMPKPKGAARQSLLALAHLFYGALIPTLAMVNFPQAILLAGLVILALSPIFSIPIPAQKTEVPLGKFALAALLLWPAVHELKLEWEMFGNLAWPAVFAVLVPLFTVSWMTPREWE